MTIILMVKHRPPKLHLLSLEESARDIVFEYAHFSHVIKCNSQVTSLAEHIASLPPQSMKISKALIRGTSLVQNPAHFHLLYLTKTQKPNHSIMKSPFCVWVCLGLDPPPWRVNSLFQEVN